MPNYNKLLKKYNEAMTAFREHRFELAFGLFDQVDEELADEAYADTWKQVEDNIRKLIAEDTDYGVFRALANVGRAGALEGLKRYDEAYVSMEYADSMFDKAAPDDPRHANALMGLAKLEMWNSGDKEKARSFAEKAATIQKRAGEPDKELIQETAGFLAGIEK